MVYELNLHKVVKGNSDTRGPVWEESCWSEDMLGRDNNEQIHSISKALLTLHPKCTSEHSSPLFLLPPPSSRSPSSPIWTMAVDP